MAAKSKIPEPVLVRCCDCRHSSPVTDRFLDHYSDPVLCQCDKRRFLHFLRIPNRCEFYEQAKTKT